VGRAKGTVSASQFHSWPGRGIGRRRFAAGQQGVSASPSTRSDSGPLRSEGAIQAASTAQGARAPGSSEIKTRAHAPRPSVPSALAGILSGQSHGNGNSKTRRIRQTDLSLPAAPLSLRLPTNWYRIEQQNIVTLSIGRHHRALA